MLSERPGWENWIVSLGMCQNSTFLFCFEMISEVSDRPCCMQANKYFKAKSDILNGLFYFFSEEW